MKDGLDQAQAATFDFSFQVSIFFSCVRDEFPKERVGLGRLRGGLRYLSG